MFAKKGAKFITTNEIVREKPIYLGADHAGFKLKEQIKKELKKMSYPFEDLGNTRFDKNDDYPDFAYKVAKKVALENSKGILFCGSSQGVCIVANKVFDIRAVSANTVEEAVKTREHNNANVLCLSGWNLSQKKASEIIKAWLNTGFSSEERHKKRVNKIKRIEIHEKGMMLNGIDPK